MLGGAARRLVNQFRLMPGEQAVVVTSSDEGIEAAIDLADGGVNVLAVADAAARRRRSGRRGRRHRVPGRASARGRPRAARPSPASSSAAAASTARWPATCWSCPAAASARRPSSARPAAASATTATSGATCRTACPTGMRVVGAAAGSRAAAGAVPAKAAKTMCKQFVCFCEDVTTKDIALSLNEGFRSLELSKRYTTVTMGPCQGRMCHRNSGLVIADELGLDPDAQRVGVTTARPPHNPTSFSLLAARGYEPVKRTSMHHWHAEHGGKMLWAGDWKRPYDYGDSESEAEAVHESLGPDRRLHAGQADRARARRGRLPGAALPEPLRRHEAGARPLRHRLRRRRIDHRRRHRRPALRARVLRHHDIVRRRRHGAVVHLVERGLEDGLRDRERDLDDRRLQPGRPERPHGAAAADRASTCPTRPSRTWAPATPRSPAYPA